MMDQSDPMDEPPTFSVVIPFFQRQQGLLRRAVVSVLGQTRVPKPQIIVIDDGSPVPAESELSDLLPNHRDQIVILTQDNQGPGAARNLGIDYARRRSPYIAFLDSDDVWAPAHLATAKVALDKGFDWFFCDATLRDGRSSVFNNMRFPSKDHQLLSNDDRLFAYLGDMSNLILSHCPICTPAVVYRADAYPISFRTDLLTAGEDYLFWIEMASLRKPVAFSTQQNVRLGCGFSIYDSVNWATSRHIWQTYYNLASANIALAYFSLTDENRLYARTRITEFRKRFADSFLSGLLGQENSGVLTAGFRFVLRDPISLLFILSALRRKAAHRILRTSKPT